MKRLSDESVKVVLSGEEQMLKRGGFLRCESMTTQKTCIGKNDKRQQSRRIDF